jgi:hypothetical protein
MVCINRANPGENRESAMSNHYSGVPCVGDGSMVTAKVSLVTDFVNRSPYRWSAARH